MVKVYLKKYISMMYIISSFATFNILELNMKLFTI